MYTLVLVKLFGLANLSKIFGICVMCQGIGAFGGGPLQSKLLLVNNSYRVILKESDRGINVHRLD